MKLTKRIRSYRKLSIAIILIHLIALTVVILSYYLRAKTEFRLNHYFVDFISAIMFISACWAFIFLFESKKLLLQLYFALFPLFIVLNVITLNGLNKAFNSIHIFPLTYNNVQFSDNQIAIYYRKNLSLNEQYHIYFKKCFLVEVKDNHYSFSDMHKTSAEVEVLDDSYYLIVQNMKYHPNGIQVNDTLNVKLI